MMNKDAFYSLKSRAINAARRAEHNPDCKKLQDVADAPVAQYWDVEPYAIKQGWV